MKTSRYILSPRDSKLARYFLIGFALSFAPLGAQTAPQPAASGATSPGSAASTITSPPRVNTSPYNTPNSGTTSHATAQGNGIYNPNGSNPPAGTVKTGTINPNVNAGGGSGSGQSGGASSPSSP